MAATRPPSLMTGQVLHVCGLAVLLAITWAAWQQVGRPSGMLFWTAVAIPVLHQFFVWFAWRRALQAQRPVAEGVFRLYIAGFFLMFGGRFVSLAVLAWDDAGSLQLPAGVQLPLAVLLALPGLYAMYSVARWFGMVRAAGADHFEERYRHLPLVRQGIFRFTSNGMYVFAFLLFWAIAVGFDSQAALIVTGFSHAYIWIHFFATEKPDMQYLYGESSAADG